jgi:hypothetical protein
MIKKYFDFIKESDQIEKGDNISSKYGDIKQEIKSMIESTIEKSGGEFKLFIDSFNKNPEDFKIEGLINDSDIYDFYLKWRNDIDEILNDINFFDGEPSEINAFGLYEYIIKGTEKSVIEIVKNL